MKLENVLCLVEDEVKKFENFVGSVKPFEDKETYKAWCAQTYYYTYHTCRLSAKAGAKVNNPYVKETFQMHTEEEQGHENLSRSDFKRLSNGSNVSDFSEFKATKSFWQTIDNWIDKNPISLFGYALALETLASKVGGELLSQASKNMSKATLFLKEHYEVDQHHIEEMHSTLSKLTESELDVVYDVTKWSFDAYTKIIEACLEYASEQKAA